MKTQLCLSLCLFLLFLIACSKDEEAETYLMAGKYNIAEITSDISLDINDDGVTSTDMFDEVPDFFNSPLRYDMKVIQSSATDVPDANLIFYFALPQMDMHDYPSPPEFSSIYRLISSFRVDYDTKSNIAAVKYVAPLENYTELGLVEKVEVIDNNHINAVYKKHLYDFQTEQWVEVTLNIKYFKVADTILD